MANEITVPLLPCRDIDEIVDFYSMLGFTQTYYQAAPEPLRGAQARRHQPALLRHA